VRIDLHSFFFQRLPQRVQIIDTIIDHECGAAGVEVFGMVEKSTTRSCHSLQPRSLSTLPQRIINLAPCEDRARAVRDRRIPR
jgi:hypothetical protein